MPEIQTIASILTAPQQQSTYLTDEEKKRILAFQELQRMAGSTNTPIYSKGTGLLKVATGALGGFLEGKAERDAAAAQAKNSEMVNQYLGMFGGINPNAAPPPPTPSVGGGGPDMGMPASPASAAASSPMGALPSFGPVADSSQQDAILANAQQQGFAPVAPPLPFPDNKIYDQGEMSPLDAAVATPGELAAPTPFQPVPDAPRIVPIPHPPALDQPSAPMSDVSPMAPMVMPGDMDRGTLFNPSTPSGLSEGATVLPNAAVKPVPIGPNGEVSTLAPSSPMADDPAPRPPADIPNASATINPRMMKAIAQIESGGNPNAVTGSYKGTYQLSESEFHRYGERGSIFNPAENER